MFLVTIIFGICQDAGIHRDDGKVPVLSFFRFGFGLRGVNAFLSFCVLHWNAPAALRSLLIGHGIISVPKDGALKETGG